MFFTFLYVAQFSTALTDPDTCFPENDKKSSSSQVSSGFTVFSGLLQQQAT